MNKVFIIAEAGDNHNGDISLAKKLVDVAKESGADAIKFQTFITEDVLLEDAPKAEYQKSTEGSHESYFDMAKKLELSEDEFKEIFSYCKKKNIKFLSTPFDFRSIDFLMELGLDIIKIPSCEITYLPYLEKIGVLNKQVFLSTGLSELEEVAEAVNVLKKYGTKGKNIVLLHCCSEYPAPFEDANLQAMLTLKKVFKCRVGYSDHTLGIEASIAATAMGASVIEKHFTLDKTMEGPDHKVSLNPEELKEMVEAVRNIELALGDGVKKPRSSELKNIKIIRRSIVAARTIKKGERFNEKNIIARRPGGGISPMLWHKILDRKAKQDYERGDFLEL